VKRSWHVHRVVTPAVGGSSPPAPAIHIGYIMKEIVIIPKGTRICPSELGHNNFYYPLPNKGTILTKDLQVSALAWIGGGSLKAYRVVGQDNVVWTERAITNEI
jgi:hypothetical protein